MAQVSGALNGVKDYKTFNLEKMTNKLVDLLNPISKMLISAYAKKYWKVIMDCFVKYYIVMLFRQSKQYEEEENFDFKTKIEEEKIFLKEFLQTNLSPKEVDELIQMVVNFSNCLSHYNDVVIEGLVNIGLKLKNKFDDSFIVGELIILESYHETPTRLELRRQASSDRRPQQGKRKTDQGEQARCSTGLLQVHPGGSERQEVHQPHPKEGSHQET